MWCVFVCESISIVNMSHEYRWPSFLLILSRTNFIVFTVYASLLKVLTVRNFLFCVDIYEPYLDFLLWFVRYRNVRSSYPKHCCAKTPSCQKVPLWYDELHILISFCMHSISSLLFDQREREPLKFAKLALTSPSP